MTEQTIQLELHSDNARRLGRRTALAATVVSAAFCLAIVVIMVFSFLREQRSNPLMDGSLMAMKAQLVREPENEPLKEKIRQADLVVRRDYFERRAFFVHGGWLLLGGMAILAVSVKLVYSFSAQPYVPVPDVPMRSNPSRVASTARLAVAGTALLLAFVLVGLAAMPRYRPPWFARFLAMSTPAAGPSTVLIEETEPATAIVLRNWPSFRGPGGSGIVPAGEFPTEWDGASGKNILWKTEIPLPGANSPVVWEGLVFLSGANETQREVYCFDARSGVLKWKQPVGKSGGPPPKILKDTGFAPATLATDGRRIYAMFPTGDVAAFDFDGKSIWSRNLGLPDNAYGHASSLVTWKNRLIVQFDQGASESAGKSALMALDGRTGQPVWQTKRPVGASWSSPILATTPSGPQIITCAKPWVMAYDPETGSEIWRVKILEGDVAPTAVCVDGVVYACNERADLAAIRTDGKGDVTKTHVTWTYPDDLPDIVSPLCTGELVFLMTTHGTLSCVDAKSGEAVWTEQMEGQFHASPTLIGKTVHLTDKAGVTHFFEAAREFKSTGKAELGEPVDASPAFVGRHIFIRGEKHLYCIGPK